MSNTRTLTKGEMQVMNVLWDLPEGGCVNDVIEHLPEPKPAYTTIATFLKILCNKQFVNFKKLQGKVHTYFPTITREEYASVVMKDVKNSLFGGSMSSLLNFFVKEEKMSDEEIQELIDMVNSHKNA